MDAVTNVLAIFGIGVIFIIGVVVGGMMVINGIKKIFNLFFKN